MESSAAKVLTDGVLALLDELGVAPDAGLQAEVEQAVALIDVDGAQAREGDLTPSDIVRVRLGKLIFRLLPPAAMRDPGTRVAVGSRVRQLSVEALGDRRRSRFLDVPR